MEHDFDDLAPIEEPVKYKKRKFVLREASEAAAIKYRDARMRGSEIVGTPDGGGPITIRQGGSAAEVQWVLVSECLYDVNGNGSVKDRPVGAEVKSWSSLVVRRLFDRVFEISPGLSEIETKDMLLKRLADTQEKLNKLATAEDAAKNLSSGGEGISA